MSSIGKVHSIEIIGDGPTGATVLTLDKRGLVSANGAIGSSVQIAWPALAGSLSSYVWTAHEGVWRLASARSIISVTGGASAAAQVRVCAGVTAIASGVAQLTAVLDLQETAPNRQNGTLIATPTDIYPGDSLALEFSGTLTGLVGVITLVVNRVQ